MTKTLLKNIVKLVIISFVIVVFNHAASAQWPHFAGSYWYGWNGYNSNYSQESVPYYALHPPVYYSYPVARTYGLFPFPYDAEPEIYYAEPGICSSVVVEPRVVANHFVEQRLTAEARPTTRQPLRIINPFVEQSATSEAAGGASWEKSNVVKPQVIYPIKLTSTN